MLRVLHFSDVHVDVPFSQMPLAGFLGKRLLGGANLLLRRRPSFLAARDKLAALAALADRESVDVAICTGDYTALGTEPELVAARAAVDPLTRRPRGFVTVPGNHDIYMPDAVADRRFERVFGDLLRSDWPEHAVDGGFPIVRLFDDSLAVIAVNSARPNPQLWRSSGRISDAQLQELERILGDDRLRGRAVLVITHYAPRRADGTPDHFTHGLENAEELLALCARVPRSAVLHGHIHHRYHVLGPAGQHLFGAGSATHAGREGIWLYEVERERVTAVPGAWSGDTYVFERGAAVEF